MKKLSLFIIFLFTSVFLHNLKSQNTEIDSLQHLLLEHTSEDTIRVNLLNNLANKVYREDYNQSLELAKEAYKISNKIKYAKGEAESLRLIGIFYSFNADYPNALKHIKKCLDKFEETGDEIGISRCLINLGDIYRNQGNYLLAMKSFQRSLKINEENHNQIGISHALIHIGIIFYEMKDYNKALEYYKRALDINHELDNKVEITYCLNNIALVYEKQNKLNESIKYYDQCIALGKEIHFIHILGWANNGKGVVLSKQKKYDEALEFLSRALEIRLSRDDKKDIAQSYNSIGNLYLKTNEYSKAKNYLLKGYKIANEIENDLNLTDAAQGLSAVYEKFGDYKNSLKYHKIYKQYSDSILNQENFVRLASLEIKAHFEKEKQAIELKQEKKDALAAEKIKRQRAVNISLILGILLMTSLAIAALLNFIQKRKANKILTEQKDQILQKNIELQNLNEEIQTQSEELKNKNDKLEELNATKNKLFSIIAHDLKSPFNSLLGISEQLAKDHNSYSDNELETYLNLIKDGTVKTYNLLENLLTWAQSQTDKIKFSPQQLNIYELVNNVISLLKETANKKEIKLISDIDKEIEIHADINMLNTIVRNLVSNAIKFTPKNGTITIKSEIIQDDSTRKVIKISVSDNGVGIPSEVKSKLFNISENITTKGTNNETGTGLGLIVCKEFVGRHGGKIWVESEENKGSEFIFTLPLLTKTVS